MRSPGSDGRTIRRERDGDFTVVSVTGGKTIDQEIHDRIRKPAFFLLDLLCVRC